ncbi:MULTISPECIES: NfuA family Fe-S biogenesis protein [Luteibacter]|uniref:Fe/S biogenesis protein NfuA n=1 Tax=Luteibacter flocculans TaxID=2780091 RepID=A0ABY4T4M0_9GAMM|nr:MULTISPECIES: NfuA family Fe-S biogenesis protein [Luteibacter]URL59660.1 NfuA family Fe-S biogenesis protein [Luteibacter flocculans]SFW63704.1 Fe/S biogenesis protein NfuA [Luteibacter sp. UNCMF366Tsu5.1]
MIDISERAQAHFLRLLSQQGDDDLGIRLRVVDAGTPSAQCELEFCSRAELSGDEWTVECEGFNLYVDGESMRWLDPANIDYETTPTGSQLNIRAPRIKGEAPGEGAGLVERVQFVLASEIAPQIASHGGRISLVEVTSDGVVVLRFGGGCHGCGMVDVTLKNGVEKTLRERIPEVTEVRDATDHDTGDKPYFARAAG